MCGRSFRSNQLLYACHHEATYHDIPSGIMMNTPGRLGTKTPLWYYHPRRKIPSCRTEVTCEKMEVSRAIRKHVEMSSSLAATLGKQESISLTKNVE